MFSAKQRKYSPVAGRTKLPMEAIVKARVARLVKSYQTTSLSDGNAKQRKKFAKLTKAEKREWRESLQRAILQVKQRVVSRALAGYKLGRHDRSKITSLSKVEALMFEHMEQSYDEIVFQGMGGKVAAAASAVAAASFVYTTTKVNEVIEQSGDLLKSFTEAIHNFVEKVKEFGSLIWKPCLIGLILWVLTRYAHANFLVAATLALVGAYLPETKELFQKYAPRGIRFQSGTISLTADMLTMMCTCWVPGKDVKAITGEFMKRTSNFTRASEGIESFLKKVVQLAEGFINFILQRNEETWLTFDGKKSAYDTWKAEVVSALKRMSEDPKLPIQEIRKFKDVQIRGFGFYEVLVTQESKRDLNFWLEKLSLALSPHEGAISAENNMRPMPYFIMFGGPSGSGKTTLVRFIASVILMLSGECSPENALDNLWQKGTSEYWNGYIGQKCLVMDDCFQVKPKPGDYDSEAMQVIRGVGNWSCPLNFADLYNKGKIYLDTPLIVGTTNCSNISATWAPYISEPKALVRRFQAAVWVSVNDEYKDENGRFAFHKVNTEFHDAIVHLASLSNDVKAGKRSPLSMDDVLGALPWHIWTLHNHTFDRENIMSEVYPGGLRGLIETAAREIRLRKVGNRNEMADLRSLLSVIGDTMASADDLEFQVGVGGMGVSSHVLPKDEVQPEDGFGPAAASSSDFEFVQKYGTNRERVDKHYEAMAAEEQYHNTLVGLYNNISNWCYNTAMKHPMLTLVAQFCAAMALSTIVKSVLKVIMSIAMGIISAIAQAITVTLELLGVKVKSTRDEGVVLHSNEKDVIPTKTKHIDIASFNFQGNLQLEVGIPPNEAVHDHVYAACVKCYTDEASVGQFIGVKGDLYLFPKHFISSFEKLDGDTKLYFKSARHGAMGEITVSTFLQLNMAQVPNYDLALVSFGGVFLKATRDITKYFLTTQEIKNVLRGGNIGVRLDVAKLNRKGDLVQVTHMSPTCYYHGSTMAGSVKINGLVRYNAPTVAGDCGAPLSVAENRFYGGRCILAIHSAGRDNVHCREGYGTACPQEVVRELVNMLGTFEDSGAVELNAKYPVPSGVERVELQDALDKAGITTGSFELVGVLPTPVSMPTKTSLKVSQFQKDEVFGPAPTAPAILRAVYRDGDKIEPMAKGLEAYQTPVIAKSTKDLTPIVDMAMLGHWQATQHHPRDVLTFEEAVNPPEGWKMKPINRRTSAGYKYSHLVTSRKPGKTTFFGFEGPLEIDDSNPSIRVLKQDVSDIIDQATKDIRKLHLCTDFLKDELRPLAKVESVATRVISGTPLDYTIAVRMYFGAFMAAMFDTYVANGMAPGINHYKEWFMVAEALLANGKDKVFDGDFSRFDASEQPWVHMAILDYINRWYRFNNDAWSCEDDKVRGILWLDLVHSRHITGPGNMLRYVVQWTKSLPSGHPLTTVVNSMYSLITLAGCYVHATGGRMDMWDHAMIITFGDDNVSSVDDEVCDLFNQVTVAQHMATLFDLKYTAGNKTADVKPYTTIDKITFLKRSFVRDDDGANSLIESHANIGWVAPIDPNSFLYEPYWYVNARTPVDDLVTRIEHCLYEMSLHSVEFWDLHFPKLERWCLRNAIPLRLINRETTRQEVKTRFQVWF
ncbi:nonstructural protein [Ginkgoaceae-associated picorna-like virus 1]|nr:nonstructural protein [Ginkgoaceae-associated picorna-like virus 1]